MLRYSQLQTEVHHKTIPGMEQPDYDILGVQAMFEE